jgi:hypothetical protein
MLRPFFLTKFWLGYEVGCTAILTYWQQLLLQLYPPSKSIYFCVQTSETVPYKALQAVFEVCRLESVSILI